MKDDRLTDDEIAILNLLADAWDGFNSLPLQHQWERQEFMHAIHNAQRLVLARPTIRSHDLEDDFVHEADTLAADTNRPDWADNAKWVIDNDRP